ncbi:MAG: replication endonuclease [Sulfurimonas sp.]|jgi:hypothetical protein
MYGLNTDIKKYIDKKIEKNKTFLKNLTFYTEDYNLVSMFDSDMNANLSPQRYFAEVSNRVNTIFKISKELNLYPAFVTITAPSEYHNSSATFNGSTPRGTALHLSQLWKKFLNLKVFTHIKNNSGHNMIYIRVYEPHKSGVPHLHAMIFVPKDYIKEVESKFYEHFTKFTINKKALKFITNFSHARYEDSKGAIAYILKYMNKTFKSAKDDTMTNEAYYFAYHGIRRFITSQTLIPLWIYRKIKHSADTRDLHKLTNQYKNGHIYHSFDKTYINERYLKKEVIEYSHDHVETIVTVEEKIIFQKNHFISCQFQNFNLVYEDVPCSWNKKKNLIPIFENGKITHFYKNGKVTKYNKHITSMSDLELYSYYEDYDVDNGSYVHYLAVRNLLISKKLLHGQIYNLNNFSLDIFFNGVKLNEIYLFDFKIVF